MRRVKLRLAFAAGLIIASGACDLGPSGSGTASGRVTGDANLGAVVLDVTWPGVTGFVGQGSTQVYSAPVAGVADRYRVILVSPTGGDLPFAVEIADAYLRSPTITVVEAVGADDRARSVSGLRVVFER